MPFNRPTLQTIEQRLQTDAESRLAGSKSQLRHGLLNILLRTIAGVIHGIYGYLQHMITSLHPWTTSGQELRRWAATWSTHPLPAVPSTGSVTFTGNNWAVIKAGTTLQRADGTLYTTTAEAVISDGSAVATVIASEPGVHTNAASGTSLVPLSPIGGVQPDAVVTIDGLGGGADEETEDQLRARWHARVQRRGEGGSTDDYHRWTREIPGVTRTWVFPLWMGLGTVGVFFMRDNDINPFPGEIERAAVHDHIMSQAPADLDQVYVVTPTAHPVDITIALYPNTESVRGAALTQLEDLFLDTADVEGGGGEGRIRLTHITQAISNASGEEDHTVSLASDITPAPGEIATLGVVTFEDMA